MMRCVTLMSVPDTRFDVWSLYKDDLMSLHDFIIFAILKQDFRLKGLTSDIKHRIFNARVAKLVDALSSGGSIRKVVLVRIQSRALKKAEEYYLLRLFV